MKQLMVLGFGALVAGVMFSGCGSEGTPGGNTDAAKVIGTAPDSPQYGQASSDLMNKMHSGPMDITKKAAEKK